MHVAVSLQASQHPLADMRPLAEPANFDPRRRRGLGNLRNRRHKLGELDAAAAAAAVWLRSELSEQYFFSAKPSGKRGRASSRRSRDRATCLGAAR